MRRVVILGGGFAGLTLARALEAQGPGAFEVTLIDRGGGCALTPLLFEVASGALAPDRAFRPASRVLCGTRVVTGEVRDVDLRRRTLEAAPYDGRPPVRLGWDDLVIAWGCRAARPDLPGAGHAATFRTVADATAVRARVVALLDGAARSGDPARRRATIAVVGGGLVGVELAAELAAALDRDGPARGLVGAEAPRVALLEAGPRLLAGHAAAFAEAAQAGLLARGVDVYLGAAVEAIGRGGVRLRGGREVPAGLVVLAAGAEANPLARALELPVAGGRVAAGATLAVPDLPGVWALGDAAAVPAEDGVCAPLAQHAVRQAARLAANLAATARGVAPSPYRWRSPGVIASLGPGDGVAELLGWTLRGPAVWAARRAYYLATLQDPVGQAGLVTDWVQDLAGDPLAAWRGLGPTRVVAPEGAPITARAPSIRVLWAPEHPAARAGGGELPRLAEGRGDAAEPRDGPERFGG